ncbi:DUF1643 domain-containing protein [Evansella cellulosilytica]|uniref:DUF1643 domain-containing protein n=1 Tax=Evansella cellulosilytica (strain ATCC 21833 / DSM 2522 / FERM P-1141 / JCM 9156 / N-4) TaxID=649639 RepID=E6TR35_EVAC2|nr:DUF1643 domain-containing protein [Evansella cellulosilytica]ADU29411.1 hypothetical protein Bcell_1143 [Evansella cellulosilytica DSM 2522]
MEKLVSKGEFLAADQLRKEFQVEASFYQTNIGKKKYQCRNHAVIMRKGFTRNDQADAVILMANPGSCSPSDRSYEFPTVQGIVKSIPYISVNDDPTQRQLMRLMKLLDWNVISIVNLSDFCSGSMKKFGENLKQAEKYNFDNHTIFAEDRVKELELLLSGPKTKLILAWGKNTNIRKLANKVLCNLPVEKILYGLRYKSPKWGFRHPYPMIPDKCKAWLEDMDEQLNDTDTNNRAY